MYMYEGYHFAGMHLLWWLIWFIFLFWVFALPYRIPGQRNRTKTALDILNERLAKSEITNEEYLAMKKLITRF
jgi:putative membrane protein